MCVVAFLCLTCFNCAHTELKRVNLLPPSASAFLALRNNHKLMATFVDHIMGPVLMLQKNFQEATLTQLVSEIFTLQDEAFVLLIIENIWDNYVTSDQSWSTGSCHSWQKQHLHCTVKYTTKFNKSP